MADRTQSSNPILGLLAAIAFDPSLESVGKRARNPLLPTLILYMDAGSEHHRRPRSRMVAFFKHPFAGGHDRCGLQIVRETSAKQRGCPFRHVAIRPASDPCRRSFVGVGKRRNAVHSSCISFDSRSSSSGANYPHELSQTRGERGAICCLPLD
jgi:hypothetical protein